MHERACVSARVLAQNLEIRHFHRLNISPAMATTGAISFLVISVCVVSCVAVPRISQREFYDEVRQLLALSNEGQKVSERNGGDVKLTWWWRQNWSSKVSVSVWQSGNLDDPHIETLIGNWRYVCLCLWWTFIKFIHVKFPNRSSRS